MSLTNPKDVITEQRLSEFYGEILPYLGGMPEAVCNKFSKGDLYSTDEKIIGCWTDGKPIYQKVFTGTGPSAGDTWLTVSIGATIDNVIDFYGVAYPSAKTSACYSVNMYASSSEYIRTTVTTNSHSTSSSRNKLSIKVGSSFINYKYAIVVKYTKTTDAANSFNYGNETDYSTSEKIVGTWIDGKPLYQKTISITIPTAAETGSIVTSYVNVNASISKYIRIDAFVENGTGGTITLPRIGNNTQAIKATTTATHTHGQSSVTVIGATNIHASHANQLYVMNSDPAYNSLTGYVTIQYTKTTD